MMTLARVTDLLQDVQEALSEALETALDVAMQTQEALAEQDFDSVAESLRLLLEILDQARAATQSEE